MMKCGGRRSGEQEIRVQVIRIAGHQAVREKIEDGGRMAEKRRISNTEQGILNDDVRRAKNRGMENLELRI